MKIVYIAESIIPSQTANSIHVMKMCQAFTANGHEVVLIIPNRIDKNIETDDVYDFYGVKKYFKIIRLPFYGGKLGFFIFSFASILKAKQEKPELIYTRFLYSCFFSLLMNMRTIFEIHSSFVTVIDRIFFFLMKKMELKKIVVISQSLRSYFVGKYKIKEGMIIVAPDGADPAPVHLNLVKFSKKDKLTVGYVGHLYKGRGIELIDQIAKKCHWVEFHIIGGLPEDLEYWKKKLEKQTNIIFYGHVPHKRVYEYMLAFDALIAPYQERVSVYGGGNTAQWMSPLKIFEYMASGKVILSSDLPALKEILKHGENSLLAAPTDIDKWISNLEQIKADIQLREKLGNAAKKELEEKYSWNSRANYILKNSNII